MTDIDDLEMEQEIEQQEQVEKASRSTQACSFGKAMKSLFDVEDGFYQQQAPLFIDGAESYGELDVFLASHDLPGVSSLVPHLKPRLPTEWLTPDLLDELRLAGNCLLWAKKEVFGGRDWVEVKKNLSQLRKSSFLSIARCKEQEVQKKFLLDQVDGKNAERPSEKSVAELNTALKAAVLKLQNGRDEAAKNKAAARAAAEALSESYATAYKALIATLPALLSRKAPAADFETLFDDQLEFIWDLQQSLHTYLGEIDAYRLHVESIKKNRVQAQAATTGVNTA